MQRPMCCFLVKANAPRGVLQLKVGTNLNRALKNVIKTLDRLWLGVLQWKVRKTINTTYFGHKLYISLSLSLSLSLFSLFFSPLSVILQFETSGKWPDNIQGIQYVKAAFHVRLAELLKKECSLPAVATPKYVDVLKVSEVCFACKNLLVNYSLFCFVLLF